MENSEVAAAEVAFKEALRLGVNRAEVVVPLGQAVLAQGKHRALLDDKLFTPQGLPHDIQLQTHLLRAQAQADLGDMAAAGDQANLNYSVIRSPISGVVIARDVDIGQTVAANFQTPTLFQIAKDLRQMQINISVTEADIGYLHIHQPINFTVDAFQHRKFTGLVKQVRLNPTIQENVVTYNVVAMVDNADGTLLPGMTANIHFVVAQKTDVLRVPNAALRFQPKNIDTSESSKAAKLTDQSTLYLLSADQPLPVNVTTGISDGNFSEILSGEIKAGDKIILSETADKKESESKFKLRVF